MKAAKVVGIIAAGVVGLVILALVLVYLLVNPNDFKPKITAAVRRSTGRDLILQGDIKLSVFPWVALTLGPASLGNPPGFADVPLLAFKHADVRVRLLPLLSRRLEVAKVELDGLDLRLVKTAAGKANWRFNQGTDNSAGQNSESGGASLGSIGGISVTHGRLSYNDQVIENLAFQTSAIAGPRPRDFRIDTISLQGDVDRAGGSPVHYALRGGQFEIDLDGQTVNLPQFSLDLGPAKISGKLGGTRITDDPHLSGTVTLAPVELREFAAALDVALPKTRDASALKSFSASTAFSYDAAEVALSDLQMKLDDSTLKGELALSAGTARSVRFNLGVDRIDLDRYRAPPGATPQTAQKASPPPSEQADADASPPLAAQGVFTLGAAHVAGLDFGHLSVTLQMKDKVTHLYPLQAQLYGGSYSGNLTYDARSAVARISMDEHLANVDVAQLLANTKAKGRIEGRAGVNIKGSASGSDSDDILRSLNGIFDASLAKGALDGLDLGYDVAMAQALINKQPGPGIASTGKTAFDAFKASAQISNGVAQTKDLTISSAVLKVTGQGSVNLPTSGIDMTLLASVLKSPGQSVADIPLKVAGSYTSPSVKPDLGALAKDQLKQKAQDLLKKNGIDLNSLFKKK